MSYGPPMLVPYVPTVVDRSVPEGFCDGDSDDGVVLLVPLALPARGPLPTPRGLRPAPSLSPGADPALSVCCCCCCTCWGCTRLGELPTPTALSTEESTEGPAYLGRRRTAWGKLGPHCSVQPWTRALPAMMIRTGM